MVEDERMGSLQEAHIKTEYAHCGERLLSQLPIPNFGRIFPCFVDDDDAAPANLGRSYYGYETVLTYLGVTAYSTVFELSCPGARPLLLQWHSTCSERLGFVRRSRPQARIMAECQDSCNNGLCDPFMGAGGMSGYHTLQYTLDGFKRCHSDHAYAINKGRLLHLDHFYRHYSIGITPYWKLCRVHYMEIHVLLQKWFRRLFSPDLNLQCLVWMFFIVHQLAQTSISLFNQLMSNEQHELCDPEVHLRAAERVLDEIAAKVANRYIVDWLVSVHKQVLTLQHIASWGVPSISVRLQCR